MSQSDDEDETLDAAPPDERGLPSAETSRQYQNHSVLELFHLLKWARGRLGRIADHLEYEHEPDHPESNRSHREDMLLLIRDFQRGIALLEAGRCQEETLVRLLRRVRVLEVRNGAQFEAAGLSRDPLDSGLVDKLKPIVSFARTEIEVLLGEVERALGGSRQF